MASLRLQGLRRVLGGRRVVDDVDLEVADGEFLVLLGPSGCGKSTILRLVAGLDRPDAGAILLDGASVTHLEPKARDVAMVFQDYALYPHRTVARNVGFPLEMAKVPAAERRRRVAEALARLGIADLAERRPAQLSGGQQQRVALARALVRRPRLFLLDEPLSNVDARLRAEMRAELARLHRELGATVLYVTHDQVEAMTLGDRIAVLEGGRLRQVGPPQEVWARPAHRFVAGFLGAPPMNLLDGAAAAPLRPASAPPDCTVGFRPHEADAEGPLRGRVVLVEELGHETLVHAATPEGAAFVVARPPGRAPAVGAELTVGVAPGALHLFDAATGRRVEE